MRSTQNPVSAIPTLVFLLETLSEKALAHSATPRHPARGSQAMIINFSLLWRNVGSSLAAFPPFPSQIFAENLVLLYRNYLCFFKTHSASFLNQEMHTP